MRIAVLLLASIFVHGCTDPSSSGDGDTGAATAEAESGVYPGSDAPLADLGLWELATDDPFPDRPADTTCPLGYGVENGLFEIESDLCPYGAFVQPSLAPVRAGDEVELILVHDALYAEDPGAQAHIGIALGEEIGWETWVPIPAQPGFFRPIFVAQGDHPRGTPVTLHVHNHGVNDYRIVSVTVLWAE
jgi:hypothetical protein